MTKAPAGRGIFVERITLSKDGKSFTSKIKYDRFDTAGKPANGGGTATGKGVKLAFLASAWRSHRTSPNSGWYSERMR